MSADLHDGNRVPVGTRASGDLRRTMNTWQNDVLALDSIDDVGTEVVRLRAARHHNCHT